MQNSKAITAKTSLSAILLLTLLLVALAVQTCSAQATQPEQDKVTSFLKEVIQLDVDHYKLTLTDDDFNVDTLWLTYSLEPKAFLSLEKSHTLNFKIYNDNLTSFDVQPGYDCLVFTQPRPDRFNETLGILERYQIWLNDPQVGEMAALLRQVGSEQSLFQASGNLSLRIQIYSNTGEYRFSNYINGVEYSGITITQSSTGSIFFTDTRASQPIGNTTISITKDQAIAIAQDYIASNPFRGNTGDSKEIANMKITGIKDVTLKSSLRTNLKLYPYYDVQFTFENSPSSTIENCGVRVGAGDGVIWSRYCSYSLPTLPVPIFNILVIALVTFLVSVAALAGINLWRLRVKATPSVSE